MPWTKGSADGLIAYFEVIGEQFKVAAYEAMVQLVAESETAMLKRIEEATTPTGDARAAGNKSSSRDAGFGSAGRIESKDMYDAVSSRVETVNGGSAGTDIIGRFGWLDGFEDYFEYQEEGTSTIAPMHALFDTFVEAAAKLDGLDLKP